MKKDRLMILTKTKELIIELYNILDKYPKEYYYLRDSIIKSGHELLELIYKTNYMDVKERINNKGDILVTIEILKLNLLSSRNRKFITKKINDDFNYKLTSINKRVNSLIYINVKD